MNGPRKPRPFLLAVLLFLPTLAASSAAAEGVFAVQGADLWGGPGAKGAGTAGSRYETVVHITSQTAAAGTVDFWVKGSLAATVAFSLPALGAIEVPTPALLEGAGAYLYRVRADVSVTAWSETYNDTPAGRFGVSFRTFAVTEFLGAGDEANGGGVEASTAQALGHARTNVGLLCNPGSLLPCQVEVSAFDGGALLGSGTLNGDPGAAAQAALSALVPATAERSGLLVRFRVLSGSALPYVIKNDNLTSDGTAVPVSVIRGSFSTAPGISFFTATPASGCGPLSVTLSWATVGAVRVNISGVAGDLLATGTATTTIASTTDLVLTAFSASGEAATRPVRVTVLPPSTPPTPAPASGTTIPGGTLIGVLPVSGTNVSVSFTRHDSTGSTFLVSGSSYTYTAGTAAGIDVVELTSSAACGSATATFTATVSTSLAPVITTFVADPSASCRTNNNIVLHWATENALSVSLVGLMSGLTTSGSTVFSYTDLDLSKSFTLQALGYGGKKVTATLTVPVDVALEYPVVSPVLFNSDTVTNTPISITNVTDLTKLNFFVVQNPSGGAFFFSPGGPPGGTSYYRTGSRGGVTDIIRVTFHNGCGNSYAEFRVNVNPE